MADPEKPLVVTFKRKEWDFSNQADVANLLEPTYTHPNVILDITIVTYADSTIFRALITMRKERMGRGLVPARIVVPSPQMRRLFKILGFDVIWPLDYTLEGALAAANARRRRDTAAH